MLTEIRQGRSRVNRNDGQVDLSRLSRAEREKAGGFPLLFALSFRPFGYCFGHMALKGAHQYDKQDAILTWS